MGPQEPKPLQGGATQRRATFAKSADAPQLSTKLGLARSSASGGLRFSLLGDMFTQGALTRGRGLVKLLLMQDVVFSVVGERMYLCPFAGHESYIKGVAQHCAYGYGL